MKPTYAAAFALSLVAAGLGATPSPGVALTAASDFRAAYSIREPAWALTVPPPAPKPRPLPVASPAPAPSGPRFRTPGGAMRYLARAYNRNDQAALRWITDESARWSLEYMRAEATNLWYTGCKSVGEGVYECTFGHGFPRRLHRTGHGHAVFGVTRHPRSGWVLSVFESCG